MRGAGSRQFGKPRMKTWIVCVGIWMGIMSGAQISSADEIYTFIIKKQEEKAKSRWSLQDWLKTRDRMRLMDLWLALHTPSPFEFYAGGDYQWGSLPSKSYTAFGFHSAAYASIFGLGYEREFDPLLENLFLFKLRVFGYQDQGTNITVDAGFRKRDSIPRAQITLSPSLTLYLGRYFGVAGRWRHFFGDQPSERYEGDVFIDFRALRVFARYFAQTEVRRHGFSVGTRFYF